MKLKSYLAGLLTLILLTTCVRNPVTGKRQFAVMSEEREVALGTAYDPQIIAEFGLYQDSVIQAYINEKGKEMAAISHRSKLDYKFRIVDSPIVNAFAVPGGYVYFTRGIMAHFNNEAEFAGVLGHEIGHVTARHTVVAQRNATFAQLGFIAGMIASPELAQFAEPLSSGVGLLLLKFGRDAESQSDELGVEYSSKIGYDAQEMSKFFSTLARKSEAAGARVPEFMSTHPDPLNRKEDVAQLAGEWQTKLDLSDPKVGRDKYLSMLDGLVYGEDPRQGFVENSIFYHPELKFQMPVPTGWQYQNSPQQFQMAPEDGKALMFLALAQGESVSEAANALVEQYGLQSVSSNQTSIHGNQAMEVIGNQVTQEAQGDTPAGTPTVKLKMTLISYGGLIYQLTGVSAFEDFNNYVAQFNTTMKQFKELTDQEKLNRLPDRLKIVTVSSSKSLSDELSDRGIPSDRLEEWAIVNGMQLTDIVNSGTKLKVLK